MPRKVQVRDLRIIFIDYSSERIEHELVLIIEIAAALRLEIDSRVFVAFAAVFTGDYTVARTPASDRSR